MCALEFRQSERCKEGLFHKQGKQIPVADNGLGGGKNLCIFLYYEICPNFSVVNL